MDNSDFGKLSPELRLMVYKFALYMPDGIIIGDDHERSELALTRVCRVMRKEVLGDVFKLFTIVVKSRETPWMKEIMLYRPGQIIEALEDGAIAIEKLPRTFRDEVQNYTLQTRITINTNSPSNGVDKLTEKDWDKLREALKMFIKAAQSKRVSIRLVCKHYEVPYIDWRPKVECKAHGPETNGRRDRIAIELPLGNHQAAKDAVAETFKAFKEKELDSHLGHDGCSIERFKFSIQRAMREAERVMERFVEGFWKDE